MEKLNLTEMTLSQEERKQKEQLRKIREENTAELNKIKTLLEEQRDVGCEWEKELAILKFRFSCKLDSIQHSNKCLDEELKNMKVNLWFSEKEIAFCIEGPNKKSRM